MKGHYRYKDKHVDYQKRPEQIRKAQAARIVECPRNAVELRRLLNTWHDIDRDKKRVMSKINSEKYMTKLKYRELLTGETSSWLDENLLLPPGFRYHANGEAKKGKISREVSKSKSLNLTKTGHVNSSPSPDHNVKLNTILSNKTQSDIDDDIKETEKALEEMKTDRQLHAINRRISQVKKSLTFLKAHSSNNVRDTHLTDASSTAKLSGTKCEACFTRLKWSHEHEIRPSFSGRSSLTSSPSTRSVSSSMGLLRSTLSSRLSTAPQNRSQILRARTASPPKVCVKSATSMLTRHGNNCGKTSTESELFSSKQGAGKRKVDSTSSISAKISIMGGKTESKDKTEKKGKGSKTKNNPSSPWTLRNKNPNLKTQSDITVTSSSKSTKSTSHAVKCGSQCGDSPKPRSTASVSPIRAGSRSKEEQTLGPVSQSEAVLRMRLSEDRYRYVMTKSAITDSHQLATLSAMFDEAGLLDTGRAGGGPRSSECRIRATQRSTPGLSSAAAAHPSGATTRERMSDARRTRLDLDAKCSREKMDDFLRRLPTPHVTIRRWRTSTGDIQMIKRSATPPTGTDILQVAPSDDGDAEDESEARGTPSEDGRESPDSESCLQINPSLTSWPTHWAQRAAASHMHTSSRDVTTARDAGKAEDSLREFRKLSRCRYLRLPPRVLARYQTPGPAAHAWN